MNKYRKLFYWLSLIFFALLIIFSAYGAIKGTDWSRSFFNSIPLTLYWAGFAILIAVSFFIFPRLLKKPGLLAMHMGCILIIAGSMWSSYGGHMFQKEYFGSEKVQSGYMAIIENTSSNTIYNDTETLYDHYFNKINHGIDPNSVHKQPFSIRLNNFHIKHYDKARLVAVDEEGLVKSEYFKIGKELDLGPDYGKVIPIKKYNNLKIGIEEGKSFGFESKDPGENSALEVLIKHPDGTEEKKFIYENFPDFNIINNKYQLKYVRIISDYISELEVIEDGKVVAQKDIVVNKPLYYGGYHFYQSSYQPMNDGSYATILSVTSDSGLYPVFIGFFLLCAGIVYHLWIEQLLRKREK